MTRRAPSKSSTATKRVLYVEANEDGTVGGSHKVMANLAVRLAPRFQPVVLFFQDNPWRKRLEDRGVEVLTWDEEREVERRVGARMGRPGSLLNLASAIARRVRLIREHRIDLVHLNNSHRVGVEEWIPATRIAGVPCVAYAHGDRAMEPRAWRRFLIRRLRHVFPVSRMIRQGVLTNGIGEDRVTLTYPYLDPPTSVRPADEVIQELGTPPGTTLAVMVGNLRHWKGQHVVLEALGGLEPELRGRLRLLMVGNDSDTDYTAQLRSLIEEHDLEDTVELTGWRDDVPDLLSAAELAIHSSVLAEPFGLVVLEALRHGCAVIAAKDGGPGEMVEDGVTGLTFDTANPGELTARLELLLRDRALVARLREQAPKAAARFDAESHVSAIEQVYDRLLGLGS